MNNGKIWVCPIWFVNVKNIVQKQEQNHIENLTLILMLQYCEIDLKKKFSAYLMNDKKKLSIFLKYFSVLYYLPCIGQPFLKENLLILIPIISNRLLLCRSNFLSLYDAYSSTSTNGKKEKWKRDTIWTK